MKKIREIRLKDIITYALLPPIAIALIWLCYAYRLPEFGLGAGIVLAVTLAVPTYYLLKRFAIGFVLLYKALAPASMRDRCRFEPSCSTYMIMAIKKYGLFIGLYKGVRRITRCKPPNGGIDYP